MLAVVDGGELSYQEHAEGFAHHTIEQIQRWIPGHHEEIGQEEVFTATVIQQSVMLTAEQSLIGILIEREIEK